MKNLFRAVIFLLLVFPAFAEDSVFLKNQNEVIKTQFETGDEIYINGTCTSAANQIVKIYITNDKIWQAGDKFSDVSAGIETLDIPYDGRISAMIWKIPPNKQGVYDVLVDIITPPVLDANGDDLYNTKLQDYEKQCAIGATGPGFQVGNPAPPPPPVTPSPPPSPPPASTPPPPPSPLPAKPSEAFSLDEYVEVKSLSNVRKSAGGTLIGTQTQGALGIIVGGPVQASLGGSNYWFWNINFENDPDGWVSESTLKSAPAPQEETTIEETVATTSPITEINAIEEMPTEETANEKMLAQVSGTDKGFELNTFMGSIIIGAALFLGIIFGSIIIARTLRKK